MSRTRHPHEKGTPLAGKRWHKRNIVSKPEAQEPRRDDVRIDAVQAEAELEDLFTDDDDWGVRVCPTCAGATQTGYVCPTCNGRQVLP